MEHRFRGIKLQADLIRRLVALGEDPGLYEELPGIRTKEGKTSRRSPPPAPAPASLRRRQPCPSLAALVPVSLAATGGVIPSRPVFEKAGPLRRETDADLTTEIQKYFGASTPDGLGFQFRSINKGANVLKQAVANGEDPVDAFAAQLKGGASAAGSVPATPSHQHRTPGSTTGTGKRARSGGVPSSKRHKAVKIEPEPDVVDFEDDADSPDADYSELDLTPTKLKPRVLSTPRKNPQLVPHAAWVKPADKIPPRPRPIPIAPAPLRAAAPAAYTIAPIAGLGSAPVPNGYTDPATGFGYNCAPPLAMGSAGPSAADSPAMGMTDTRRGSAFSNGSFTAGSSPATPTMLFSTAVPSTGANMTMVNVPGKGMKATVSGRAPTNMNPTSFNMAMFETAASPNSASEAHTPQTTASSTTVVGSAANFTEASSKANRDDFSPFDLLPVVGNGTTRNTGRAARNTNANAKDNDYMDFSFGNNVDDFEAALDLGGYGDDEGFEDAGEC